MDDDNKTELNELKLLIEKIALNFTYLGKEDFSTIEQNVINTLKENGYLIYNKSHKIYCVTPKSNEKGN